MSEGKEEIREEEKSKNNRPRVVRRLPNVVCRDGLSLLGGTLILTERDITLANATQIRGRIDLNSPAPEEDSTEEQQNSKDDKNKKSISIPLESIESITYGTALGRPSLGFAWKDNTRAFGKARRTDFIQRAGRGVERKEDRLVTWIAVIDDIKNGSLNPPQNDIADDDGHQQRQEEKKDTGNESAPPVPVDTSKLESEIMFVLDQKDWKGPFQIANELRDTYGGKYDFDLVETLCKKMAKNKLIEEDKVGEFFRKGKK
jgi:hypothetical protein